MTLILCPDHMTDLLPQSHDFDPPVIEAEDQSHVIMIEDQVM
jgi:hypothetical protein